MFTYKQRFYHVFLRIQKATIYLFFFGLAYVVPELSTRQLLRVISLGLIFFLYKYTIKKWVQYIGYKKAGSDKITFNGALASEIFLIKHKLNELLINKDLEQKKANTSVNQIEKDRKSFHEREYFYKDYNRVVHQAFYKTPDGEDGSIIIFMQKSEVRYSTYFDRIPPIIPPITKSIKTR